MKYDVTFTEQAENDLRGVFEYIAFDLLSPENAAGQLDRIEEKILSLGEYPEKFRQYEREPWKSRNTRVVPVDNYVIFYIPDKTKKYPMRRIRRSLISYRKQEKSWKARRLLSSGKPYRRVRSWDIRENNMRIWRAFLRTARQGSESNLPHQEERSGKY